MQFCSFNRTFHHPTITPSLLPIIFQSYQSSSKFPFKMQIKNIIFSGLLAGAAMAAPVTSADTTIEKRAGKCDAHIYVDG